MDYIVQPGDSLWRIAAKHLGNGAAWSSIANDNHLHRHCRLLVGERLWLRDTLLKTSSGAAAPHLLAHEPMQGIEGAPSVVPARAFFFVLADEIDPLRQKLVRKVMVSEAMATAYAKEVGRPIRLQANPARYGLHPAAPHSTLPPGRHAAGMKPSSFSSASAQPFGSNRIAGSRFWIDAAKAQRPAPNLSVPARFWPTSIASREKP